MPLILWCTKLRRTLLKLHGITSSQYGFIDQLPGDVKRAIVIDAYFSNDVDGMPRTNDSVWADTERIHIL
jgi:hypothetical protein